MCYTIRDLNEIEDVAPRLGISENQESRFPAQELQSETVGLALHRVRPGMRQGFAHRHERAEEIYVVLSGTGRVKLDDTILDVAPFDAIRVAPQVARAFEAGSDGLELLAFGPQHAGDGEKLDGDFWNR